MSNYQRVTFQVRCQIDSFLQAGWSVPQISAHLGYHKSTIYREICRNYDFLGYCPHQAHWKAQKRYRACRRTYKLQGELLDFVCQALMQGWSPEQIAGRLRREKSTTISHECIYQLIARNPQLKPLLRRKRKRGAGRDTMKKRRFEKRRSIHDRPQIANERRRRGDWERDNMYGANRRQLLVCTDRKTKFTKISKLSRATSQEVAKKTMEAINSTNKKAFTVTNDNGTEFLGEPIPIKTFYCDPMKPQQRGTIENTIGLLRQWITTKTDLDKISHEEIKKIENRLNFRPRKCLNYRTPFEAFYETKVALAN